MELDTGGVQMEEVSALMKHTVSRKTGIDKINTDCYKVL